MSEEYQVILIRSASHAMRGEHLLTQADIGCKLIPVPRHISSDCGVCIRIQPEDKKEAQQILESGGVEIEGIYNI